MRKNLTTEVFWLIGIAILTYWIAYSILGDRILNGKTLELQNHDTYIIVPKIPLLVLVFAVLLLIMYLFRWLHATAMNRTVIIFAITTTPIILILLFFRWLSSLEIIREMGQSSVVDLGDINRVQMTLFSHALLTLTLGLLTLFEMTMGYKLVTKRK
jgi:hypothetical protein